MTGSELKDRVDIRVLKKTAAGNFDWVTETRTWARVEQDKRRAVFSSLSQSAAGVSVTIRAREIDLACTLVWEGQVCLPTDIRRAEPGWLTISAAMVEEDRWHSDADRPDGHVYFPGVLAERWVGHDTPDLHSQISGGYVLVCPKAVRLEPGSWVSGRGRIWRVTAPHELGRWRNEYELTAEEDC